MRKVCFRMLFDKILQPGPVSVPVANAVTGAANRQQALQLGDIGDILHNNQCQRMSMILQPGGCNQNMMNDYLPVFPGMKDALLSKGILPFGSEPDRLAQQAVLAEIGMPAVSRINRIHAMERMPAQLHLRFTVTDMKKFLSGQINSDDSRVMISEKHRGRHDVKQCFK